jgi:hypothetical protein
MIGEILVFVAIFFIGLLIGILSESDIVCPYKNKCKLYQEDSYTCNHKGGFYGERLATCRLNLESRKAERGGMK